MTSGLNPDRLTALLVNEPSGGDTDGELHGRSSTNGIRTVTDLKGKRVAVPPKSASGLGRGFEDGGCQPPGLRTESVGE